MATTFTINNQTQEEYQEAYSNGARAVATICAQSNSSLNLHFVWKTGSGIAMDLTGYTGAFSVRERKDGHLVAAVADTTGTGDGTMTVDFAGNIKIQMDYTVIQPLYKTGDWVWDLILKSPDGITTRLIEGDFKIDRGVTYFNELPGA